MRHHELYSIASFFAILVNTLYLLTEFFGKEVIISLFQRFEKYHEQGQEKEPTYDHGWDLKLRIVRSNIKDVRGSQKNKS